MQHSELLSWILLSRCPHWQSEAPSPAEVELEVGPPERRARLRGCAAGEGRASLAARKVESPGVTIYRVKIILK